MHLHRTKKNAPPPITEMWRFLFLLGLVMLNYPFLIIFDKVYLIFGIPLSVVYLLVGWPLSILVIYLFSRGLTFEEEQPRDISRSDQGSLQ
ncbi:hypothetical protein [Desulfovermiculus halophilus]|uniref:hypothetical protein n=1 Tax=Desulfovermiculus halophilus TaxID=339722 RepID=UPI000687C4DF|nr:hypothetical protein [Desulfovermiculus halophilus]